MLDSDGEVRGGLVALWEDGWVVVCGMVGGSNCCPSTAAGAHVVPRHSAEAPHHV